MKGEQKNGKTHEEMTVYFILYYNSKNMTAGDVSLALFIRQVLAKEKHLINFLLILIFFYELILINFAVHVSNI